MCLERKLIMRRETINAKSSLREKQNRKIFNLVELKTKKIPTYEICTAYCNLLRIIL